MFQALKDAALWWHECNSKTTQRGRFAWYKFCMKNDMHWCQRREQPFPLYTETDSAWLKSRSSGDNYTNEWLKISDDTSSICHTHKLHKKLGVCCLTSHSSNKPHNPVIDGPVMVGVHRTPQNWTFRHFVHISVIYYYQKIHHGSYQLLYKIGMDNLVLSAIINSYKSKEFSVLGDQKLNMQISQIIAKGFLISFKLITTAIILILSPTICINPVTQIKITKDFQLPPFW